MADSEDRDLSERLAQELLWLCSIPSPTGAEKALCDAVQAHLVELRPELGVRRYGSSLVVPLWRAQAGPRVVLAGHLDHVPTQHDGPVRREGDRVFGPGASDMKGGLCLMLDLARSGPENRLNLTLVFYAGEEGSAELNELGSVLQQDEEVRRADLAVLLEPTDNELSLGSGGSVHARVRFRGRSAHSSRPWQGQNAIYLAVPLLERLRTHAVERCQTEGLVWTDLVCATMAQGGRAPNVIPDCFELNLNHRFGPETTLEQSERRLRELLPPEAEIEIVDRSPSAPPARNHPMVMAWTEAGARSISPKIGHTDVARFFGAGVPAVNFGPGQVAQAHQPNEWASVSELVAGSIILRRWLSLISG